MKLVSSVVHISDTDLLYEYNGNDGESSYALSLMVTIAGGGLTRDREAVLVLLFIKPSSPVSQELGLSSFSGWTSRGQKDLSHSLQ